MHPRFFPTRTKTSLLTPPPAKQMGALSTPASPDISSSYEHGLPALLAGDAVHGELGNVVTAVGVNLRQLGGEKRERCNEAAASL